MNSRSHLMTVCIATLVTTIALGGARAAAPKEEGANLLKNPGFETMGAAGMPEGWEPLIIGFKPEFVVDQHDPHGGKQSMRITSTEVTRAYVVSQPIEVAPGENVQATAYVKVEDVPEKVGSVILIGAFSRADGTNASVAKFNVAKVSTTTQPVSGWQRIEGTLPVPGDVDYLRLRAGFSYSKGSCSWDDLRISTTQPVVARLNLPNEQLTPAMEPLPVTVLNRSKEKSKIRVTVSLDKKDYSANVQLTGQPVQTVSVPINVEKRGKVAVELALRRGNDDKPFFVRKINATIPPALVLDPPIPTHWAIEDGPPKISGDVWTALKPETQAGGKLSVTLLDEAGTTRGTWLAHKIQSGRNEFAISGAALPEGKYKIVAEVQPKSGQPMRVEQPWFVVPRRLAKVTINSSGFCEYDGKPIFPMGIFNSGKPAELAEAGFTITHAYNATRVFKGERPNDQGAREFLDETEKAGMKACFMVPLSFADNDWDAFRRRIRMFRNHPALLCWDEEEGLARGDWSKETLQQVSKILKEEDPNHPFMVGDANDVIFRVKDRSNFFPLPFMDLGMWWWYPIPLKKDKHIDALEGREAGGLELKPPTFLTTAKTDKPIWVGVQSYKQPKGRFPTPLEYRAQAYIAVAEGAKGLMWYGGYVTDGIFTNKNKVEGHWDEFKNIVTELRSLEDVFLAPSLDKPSLMPDKSPVSVTIRRSPKRLVLIAVNRGEQPLELKLASPSIKAGTAPVIGEKRTVTTQAGELADHFDPYASHVYELPQ
jgi:hypothetical protein